MYLPIIQVNSLWKTIFDFFIILFSLIYCMKIIYYITFVEGNQETDNFDFFVLISYTIYMILNFFQSYIDKESGEIIYSNKKIALNYLKGWFIIDLLSSLPYEIITKSPYLRLIRLIRINKIFQFFSFVERVNFKMRHYVSLFRLSFFGIFGTFILSCLWFGICLFYSKSEESNFLIKNKLSKKNPIDSLITCFYFSLTTITTTGFGDITAMNIYEKLFSTILMLVGVLFFSFLMSLLYEEIRNVGEDNQILEAQKLIFDLKKFNIGKSNKLYSDKINKKILADITFNVQHSRYEQFTKKVNFDILPRKIKDTLSEYLWKDVFNQIIEYFGFLENNKSVKTFLCKLSYHFQFKFYESEEIIYHFDRNVNEINIIQSGYVDVKNSISNLKKRLKPGDVIGHFYVLFDVPRPNYIYKAATFVEVISIEKSKLLKLFDKMIDSKIYDQMKISSMGKFRQIFKMINNSKKFNIENQANKGNLFDDFVVMK